MVKGEKGINGAGIYDEKAKNLRLKIKFIKLSLIFAKKKIFNFFYLKRSGGKMEKINWNLKLVEACATGNLIEASEAIKNGADVNMADEYGRTPLMIASYMTDELFVKLLIKAGADVKAKDKRGWTARDYALFGWRVEIAKLLDKAEKEQGENSNLYIRTGSEKVK
jgi:ankyrin repeat protein